MKNIRFQLKMSSFVNAIRGVKASIQWELHMRFHVLCTVLVAIAGVVFDINVYEWLAIVMCIGLVITAELINTAIETLVNLVSPNYHPKAGLVKDIAAGAVLVSAIIAMIVALIVFVPKFCLMI